MNYEKCQAKRVLTRNLAHPLRGFQIERVDGVFGSDRAMERFDASNSAPLGQP